MVISVETQLWLISAGRVRGGGTLGAKGESAQPANALAMDGKGRSCKRSRVNCIEQ